MEGGWSFVCGCTSCAREGDAAKQSDRRRLRIATLRESIPRLRPKEGEASLILERVGRAMVLLKEEGLEGFRDQFATAAGNVCAFHGDFKSSGR